MEPVSSLPHSYMLATCPYPELFYSAVLGTLKCNRKQLRYIIYFQNVFYF